MAVADRGERARGSFERRMWGDAFADLSAAHREGQLDVEDLEFQVSDPEVLRRRLTDAGLKDVRVERTAERPTFRSGPEMWDWVLYGNPIAGMLVADLSDDQRARVRQVLDGMLRERAGANGRAVLTNAVNIGIGTK
jgi:hypothetical protein